MKLGKRRKDDDPAAEPQAGADPVVPRERVTETWTAPVSGVTSAASYGAGEGVAIEPAVDSEAVELVGDAAPAPGPPVPPVATSIPEPPPRPPVTPPPPAAAAPPLGDPVAAPASGFAATAADPLREELRVLSTERPEIVVGAAFAGGIVAAMILRRLGN
jgi:hypothetical protein